MRTFKSIFTATVLAIVSSIFIPAIAHADQATTSAIEASYFAINGTAISSQLLAVYESNIANGSSTLSSVQTTIANQPNAPITRLNSLQIVRQLVVNLTGTEPNADALNFYSWALDTHSLTLGAVVGSLVSQPEFQVRSNTFAAVPAPTASVAPQFTQSIETSSSITASTGSINSTASTSTPTSAPAAPTPVVLVRPSMAVLVPETDVLVGLTPPPVPPKDLKAYVASLLDDAKDLQIEEQDKTQKYKDAVKKLGPQGTDTTPLMDTDSFSPTNLVAQLTQLQKDLETGGGNGVPENLMPLATKVQAWMGAMNTGGGVSPTTTSVSGTSTAMQGLTNTTNATNTATQNFLTNEVVRGKTCRNAYDSTLHTYVTVCN